MGDGWETNRLSVEPIRDQWLQELANLYLELDDARDCLLEAEQEFPMEEIERARERVASLKNAITDHRCNPWWLRIAPVRVIGSDEHRDSRAEQRRPSAKRTRDQRSLRDRL